MSIDFAAFDSAVDLTALAEEVEKTPERKDVPDGTYLVGIDRMEITTTKKGDKLMFAVQLNIKEGKQRKRKIFFNRTITGNTSPKWTDGQAIKSVCTWVNDFAQPHISFANYADFATQILDVYQDVADKIELEVNYKADDFNPVKILEVYDC